MGSVRATIGQFSQVRHRIILCPHAIEKGDMCAGLMRVEAVGRRGHMCGLLRVQVGPSEDVEKKGRTKRIRQRLPPIRFVPQAD